MLLQLAFRLLVIESTIPGALIQYLICALQSFSKHFNPKRESLWNHVTNEQVADQARHKEFTQIQPRVGRGWGSEPTTPGVGGTCSVYPGPVAVELPLDLLLAPELHEGPAVLHSLPLLGKLPEEATGGLLGPSLCTPPGLTATHS